MINGVQIPNADNCGRAFPWKNSNIMFVGPAFVNGKLWEVHVWINISENGRTYLRMSFNEPNKEPENV